MGISKIVNTTILLATFLATTQANFYNDTKIIWGDDRVKVFNNGDDLTLSLDQYSGSGFQSNDEYLFGKIDIQMKLISGNSAGSVTTYYLTSTGPNHDEIDFEFLGNVTGEPYTMHTNVFAQGVGGREQQFRLWFDPTMDYHTYSILWNPKRIVFLVDGIAVREFKNMEGNGVAFPKAQPMRVYSTLWNADDWATQGGRVKADWAQAPFTASYRNFNVNACVWVNGSSSCGLDSTSGVGSGSDSSSDWLTQELDSANLGRMKWVQDNFMIYNYCADQQRFPQGLPTECTLSE